MTNIKSGQVRDGDVLEVTFQGKVENDQFVVDDNYWGFSIPKTFLLGSDVAINLIHRPFVRPSAGVLFKVRGFLCISEGPVLLRILRNGSKLMDRASHWDGEPPWMLSVIDNWTDDVEVLDV